ncbi:MAG: hypothetical protein A2365_00140 [Candidatus Nealsonbacteria bacterium RIFOXYB1_FULL_40_15]|uniref:Uncharacterized protein n=1 Tax=Candidatus Nealsonbacteria bacterium RIFOXYB1_FULL_40_15 TaxID=1801677 RepID=A0A1G2EPN7_9BACT|nr:MAG: hypothetical protein A2365_00140 [Candidatus Nealsonbacteria bacterium RIFOXYB1_FULL_40_15]
MQNKEIEMNRGSFIPLAVAIVIFTTVLFTHPSIWDSPSGEPEPSVPKEQATAGADVFPRRMAATREYLSRRKAFWDEPNETPGVSIQRLDNCWIVLERGVTYIVAKDPKDPHWQFSQGLDALHRSGYRVMMKLPQAGLPDHVMAVWAIPDR